MISSKIWQFISKNLGKSIYTRKKKHFSKIFPFFGPKYDNFFLKKFIGPFRL
jgi:hypothetical protein